MKTSSIEGSQCVCRGIEVVRKALPRTTVTLPANSHHGDVNDRAPQTSRSITCYSKAYAVCRYQCKFYFSFRYYYNKYTIMTVSYLYQNKVDTFLHLCKTLKHFLSRGKTILNRRKRLISQTLSTLFIRSDSGQVLAYQQ